MLFGWFLHQHRGGRSIWRADREDLRVYRRARRRTPGIEMSASTWIRCIAALDKWVGWALKRCSSPLPGAYLSEASDV
jgi:hypothetical protein